MSVEGRTIRQSPSGRVSNECLTEDFSVNVAVTDDNVPPDFCGRYSRAFLCEVGVGLVHLYPFGPNLL